MGCEPTLKRILLVTLCILTVAAGASSAVAVPFFSGTSKQALLLSPLEGWTPTWNLEGYKSALEHAGYSVDIVLDGDATIPYLKTELAKYDLIILRTDSFDYEGINFYCSGEPASFRARSTYAAEISAREIYVGVCVGFSLDFLRNNYPAGSLRQSLVFAVAPGSAELASVFLPAGAAAFIGYYETFGLGWGRLDAISTKVLQFLSQGDTVKGSILDLYRYLARGHGNTATLPAIYWSGNGDFKI